jgi:site-specific DNA-methyltransferase (adenine-specific)
MDAVRSEQQKGLHAWQQGIREATHCIKTLCRLGGLVIDPFCGAGTTLLAAARLKRRYLGFEISEAVANRA